MTQTDTSLDDIAQSIADLGTMIDGRFNSVGKTLKDHGETLKEHGGMLRDQGVLMEDLEKKFDKNIDLLSKEMRVKKTVDNREERIVELEAGQKTIKKGVQLHSEQLAGR